VVQPIVEGELGYRMVVVDGQAKVRARSYGSRIFAKLHRSRSSWLTLPACGPTAFLELGYAFGRSLPTMLMVKEGSDHPFDIVTFADCTGRLRDVGRRKRRSAITGQQFKFDHPCSDGASDLMTTKREVFISTDVETSGAIPGEFSLLSIGACHVDDEALTFYCELQP